MRKLAIALGVTAAVALAGGLAWKAEALTWRSGTADLPAATKSYSQIEKAACWRPGRWCPTGFRRVCGPWRCWCAPC